MRTHVGRLEAVDMTKADIVDAVYEKVGGFSKKEAVETVEVFFNIVKDAAVKG
jgi:integration host factor subunit alpha